MCSSHPTGTILYAGVSQLVEGAPCKRDVAGSIPVASSTLTLGVNMRYKLIVINQHFKEFLQVIKVLIGEYLWKK